MSDSSLELQDLSAFESLDSAFRAALGHLFSRGASTGLITDFTSVGSGFGQKPRRTVESVCTGFVLTNPRARWIVSRARQLNRSFAVANTFWTLSGSDAVDDIGAYNRHGYKFASGTTLRGAVGTRIFASPVGDQLRLVADRLTRDPSSRRAAIQVFRPDDLANPPLDTPCTLSLHYLRRGEKLDAITYMRSQSAVLLLPYDVFLFTFLQELLASELQIDLGKYYHMCSSLHYYEDERQLLDDILAEDRWEPAAPMPAMPPRALSELSNVLDIERALRQGEWRESAYENHVDGSEIDPYWRTLLRELSDARHDADE